MEFTKEQLQGIDRMIAATISKRYLITPESQCFCGSTKTRAQCCIASTNFWLTKRNLANIIGFAKHHNFKLTKGVIPNGFIKSLESTFQTKFNVCAIPDCSKPCIKSHVFGKALLKKHFENEFCKWSLINDDGFKSWVPAGIDSEIGYKIFCAECDEKIFKKIDDIKQDLSSNKNQFLHIFRTLAYQHQFNRTMLAIAHQVAIAHIPVSYERNIHLNTFITHEQIDISHLIECYVRYSLTFSDLSKMYNILESGNLNGIESVLISRKIFTKNIFFAQGIDNPNFDLSGKKISLERDSAIIYTIIPNNDKSLVLFVLTLYDEYKPLLNQLRHSSGYKFKKYISKLLEKKNSPRGVLVSIKIQEHQKILRF